MPSLPVPIQTDAVAQDTTTGAIDYLKYLGGTLVASDAVNYGLGAAWRVVASGNIVGGAPDDLVFQNTSSGVLDFVGVNAAGAMVNSFMTPFGLPAIHGEGFFGFVAGQTGPSLLSQLPDGRLDMLSFNSSGSFVASDLIPGTAGFPALVGSGLESNGFAAFFGQGNGSVDSTLITQLPNGELDAVGITGDLGAGTLAVAHTLLLAQTIGAFPVTAVDPDFSSIGLQAPEDVPGPNGTFGVQLLTESAAGIPDNLYLDSGYGATGTEGTLYASLLLSPLGANQQLVDGSAVVHNIFPVT